MSGETPSTQSSGADPRDQMIAERDQTIAELTARVKELEEKLEALLTE